MNLAYDYFIIHNDWTEWTLFTVAAVALIPSFVVFLRRGRHGSGARVLGLVGVAVAVVCLLIDLGVGVHDMFTKHTNQDQAVAAAMTQRYAVTHAAVEYVHDGNSRYGRIPQIVATTASGGHVVCRIEDRSSRRVSVSERFIPVETRHEDMRVSCHTDDGVQVPVR